MNFNQYNDFDDFCTKNNMTPVQGLRFLDTELKKIKDLKRIGKHGKNKHRSNL